MFRNYQNKRDSNKIPLVKVYHDYFNLCYLSVLCSMNFYYISNIVIFHQRSIYDKCMLVIGGVDYESVFSSIVNMINNICVLVLYGSTSNEDASNILDIDDRNKNLFKYVYHAFFFYLLIDTSWIVMIPDATYSNANLIRLHHIILIVGLYIGYDLCFPNDSLNSGYQQSMHSSPTLFDFAVYTSLALCVEVNTIFLTLKRNLHLIDVDSCASSYGNSSWKQMLVLCMKICNCGICFLTVVSNIVFYGTWITIRLIVFPLLGYYLHVEYEKCSSGDVVIKNAMLYILCVHSFLICLNTYWTCAMLMKLLVPVREAVGFHWLHKDRGMYICTKCNKRVSVDTATCIEH